MRATGGFFALSVPDLDASAAWYVEKLGLKRASEGHPQGPASFVVLEGDGWIVELIHHTSSQPSPRSSPELTHGFTKAGLIVDDFNAAVAQLRSHQVEIVIGPFPARENIRANLIFRDNAGNMIQLFGGYAR
jgi:catechol 2,3-dioxygenase-like lactoylglutathione lyase family enzyme